MEQTTAILKASDNMYLLFHNLCGSESWDWLSWALCLEAHKAAM